MKTMIAEAINRFWDIAPIVGVSMVFVYIRNVVLAKQQTIRQYMLSNTVAIPVAYLAGMVLEGYGLSTGLVYTGVAIAALLSNDVVLALLGLGKEFRENPKKFINKH